jgi:sugar/nucleoside kinase (ribokinase family)
LIGLCADISADLTELSRTPVSVVCAGVKSILDIAKTLEVLETLGVPVLSLGQTQFPSFFTNDAGVASPASVDTTLELALAIRAARQLQLDHGFVLAVPNPEPADADTVTQAIELALREAAEAGATGRDATPFLLRRINEATGGDSYRSNVALILNNAKVAAELASEVAAAASRDRAAARPGAGSDRVPWLRNRSQAPAPGGSALQRSAHASSGSLAPSWAVPPAAPPGSRSMSTAAAGGTWPADAALPPYTSGSSTPSPGSGGIFAIGSTLMDVVARPSKADALAEGTSNPGSASLQMGGVTRNMAETAARGGARVTLYSAVGRDALGAAARAGCEAAGIVLAEPFERDGVETASYTALLHGDGEMLSAVADAAAIDGITESEAREAVVTGTAVGGANLVLTDAGLSEAALTSVCFAATSTAVRAAGVTEVRQGGGEEEDDGGLDAAIRLAESKPETLTAFEREALTELKSLRDQNAAAEQQGSEAGADPMRGSAAVLEIPQWERRGVPVVLDPVSVDKAARCGTPAVLAQTAILAPNAAELHAIKARFVEMAKGTPIGELQAPEMQAMQQTGEAGGDFQTEADLEQAMKNAEAAMHDGRADKVAEALQQLLQPQAGGGDGAAESLGFDRGDLLGMAREAGVGDMSIDDLRRVGAVTADAEEYMESLGMTEEDLADALDNFKAVMRGETPPDDGGVSDGTAAAPGEDEPVLDTLMRGQGADVTRDDLKPALLGAAQVVLAAMCNPAVEVTGVGLVEGKKHLLITLGAGGLLWVRRAPAQRLDDLVEMCGVDFLAASLHRKLDFTVVHAPQALPSEVVNVTGAGDSLLGGVSCALAAGYPMEQAVYWGMAASRLSLLAKPAVSPGMSSRAELLRAVCAICDENKESEAPAVELLARLKQLERA